MDGQKNTTSFLFIKNFRYYDNTFHFVQKNMLEIQILEFGFFYFQKILIFIKIYSDIV